MLSGLAKTLFIENYQRAPWKDHINKQKKDSWPLLNLFLQQKRLSYLDYLLASKLLINYPKIGQEVAFLICHLILAVRNGHLCIKIDSDRVTPDPSCVWQQEEGQLLSMNELNQLNELVLKGVHSIPLTLITDVNENNPGKFPSTPLCRYRNLIYLQRHWIFESLFLHNLKRLNLSKPYLNGNVDKLKNSAKLLCQQGVVLEEQAQAIIKGCIHPLSLITGGPGTGKTYTAGYLIQIFWESLNEEQKKKCRIILAAPTGKAAANLQKSLGKISSDLKGFPPLVAKTLHSLLGIKGSQTYSSEKIRLLGDLILIDESSMIDIKMMASLFEAIVDGSRLILLGDPHQLPSVEAGSVFSDLIQIQTMKEGYSIPCTQLKVCLRTERSSIVEFAQVVKEGKADAVITILQSHSHKEITHIMLPNYKQDIYCLLLQNIKHLFPSFIKEGTSHRDLLNLFNQIRLLSPMRKGPLGVEALNHLLWNHFNQLGHLNGWLAFPIMIVINDYRQDLFNGETGVLIRKLPLKYSVESHFYSEDYALFPDRGGKEERVRQIPAILLPKYEYAYCLSVHKSQGSEFDRIILLMPEGSELFGREIFYTAITRARKHLDIYGSEVVIYKTILQQGLRLSGIRERFVTL